MKKFLLSFLFSTLFINSANAEFAMLGFGKESCNQMIHTTSTGSQMDQVYKFAYTSYILGFFTGVNAMENKATGLREIDILYESTREYCEKNPSDNIYDAMIRVLSQIRN